MLNQKRSGNLARLKYLVAVPICAGLLCASTLVFSKSYGWIDLAPKHENATLMPAAAHNPGIDTSQVTKLSTTSKGYKYEETGYLINKKTDFRVIFTEKDKAQTEYYKSKATPAELTILKNKYGYTFPNMMIYPKLPPPPPAPPVKGKKPSVIDVKLPPPPPPPSNPVKTKKVSKVLEVTPVVPAAPATAVLERIPPPPPPADPFQELYTYVAKYVRYPAKALQNHISGRVILTFNIVNGKISNLTLVRGVDQAIDDEIFRVLNNFDGNLGIKSGSYSVPVFMAIQDAKGNWINPSPAKEYDSTNTVASGKSWASLNQIVVVGYSS